MVTVSQNNISFLYNLLCRQG